MADNSLHGATTTRWAKRLSLAAVVIIAVTVAALAVPVVAADASTDSDEDETVGFTGAQPIEAEPPETAEFDIAADGEPVAFEVEYDETFLLETDLEPEADDVTVLLDTSEVENGTAMVSATDAETRGTTVERSGIDDELPTGLYTVSVDDGTYQDESELVVQPYVEFETDLDLHRSDIEDDPLHSFGGVTGLESGETIDIRLESHTERLESIDEDSFLLEEEAVVEDGEFEATFDVSAVPENVLLYVVAEYDGTQKAEQSVSIQGGPREIDREQEGNDMVLAYEDERVDLEPAPGQDIGGEANLEEGETVDVRFHSNRSLNGSTFLVSEETTVDEHGSFDTSVNLDEIEPGTEFEVTATAQTDSSVNVTAPGTIVESKDNDGATTEAGQSANPDDDSQFSLSSSVQGFGAIAAGAVLSVVGIAVLVGYRRL